MATQVSSSIDELIMAYRPHAVQAAFHRSTARIRGIFGGSGSGKTTAIAAEALFQAIRYPKNEVIIARDVLADLKRTTKRTLLEEVLPPQIFNMPETEWRASEQRLNFKHNGSAIQLIGLDSPGRIGSTDCGCWIIDEAHLLAAPASWLKAFTRQSRRRGTGRCGVFAGHPQGKSNWFYKKFFVERDPEWEYFDCNPEDNRQNLPDGFIDNLHKDLADDLRYLNRYVYGKWEDFEGQVFSEFDEKRHVVDPFLIPKHWVKYRGMDYGLDAPSTCVWAAVDEQGCIWFYDEWGCRNTPIPMQVRSITLKSDADQIDMTLLDGRSAGRREQTQSGLITIAQQYRIAGLPVIPSATGKAADVEAGLLMMKGLLAADKLKIFRRGVINGRAYGCPKLIGEMFGLVYAIVKEGARPTANERFSGDDHYLDSARYISCRHFGSSLLPTEATHPGSLQALCDREMERMKHQDSASEWYD